MNAVTKASIRFSLLDAFFFSLMVGAGETYLPAYALSVGMSEWLTGFFSTVPIITGALIQMVTPWGLGWVKSPKNWVIIAASFQALAFLPLIYFSIYPSQEFIWLFLVAGVYWGAGFAVGPTWNYWMGHLIPSDEAAKFFSLRLQVSQVGLILGLVGAGIALQKDIHVGPFTSVFSFIFFIAFVARASSVFFLYMKKEGILNSSGSDQVKKQLYRTRDTLKIFWQKDQYRRFFITLFLFQVTVYISSPFVAPYFLKKLEMNYDQYMLAQAVFLISKIIAFSVAQKIIQAKSVRWLFLLGAIGISPLPALWVYCQDMSLVVLLQMTSGFFWSFFEVGLAVIFFNQIKSEEKISLLTFYNFFSSMAIILGSLIGGAILRSQDASVESYFFVFVLASILRLIAAIFLARPQCRI